MGSIYTRPRPWSGLLKSGIEIWSRLVQLESLPQELEFRIEGWHWLGVSGFKSQRSAPRMALERCPSGCWKALLPVLPALGFSTLSLISQNCPWISWNWICFSFCEGSQNQFQLLATRSNLRVLFKIAEAEKHGEGETETQDRQRDSEIESKYLKCVHLMI